MALAGIAAAAIPAGWIALRHVPAEGEESGYWILVREPEDGLAAWWSDEELARIIAGAEDYVQHLETGWSPEEHEVASSTEAKELAEELAKYWDGDLPQANYWAHGALTRRGDTLSAFRWEQDGLTQRTGLEGAGARPKTAVAPIDPDPVDQRYDNGSDIVTYGDRWGSHLRSGTLDHIYTSERNKAQRRHHPNPPTAAEVKQAASQTVRACREASLKSELGVFSNYVRAWGGLSAQNVSFGLPANCVVDPGPVTPSPPPVTVPPLIPPAPKPPTKPVTPPAPPKPQPKPVTPPPPPKPKPPKPKPVAPSPPPKPKPPKPKPVTPPPLTPSPPPPDCPPGFEWLCGGNTDPGTTDPDPISTNPGNGGGSDPGSGNNDGTNGGGGTNPPTPYEACDGTMHPTQAAADAVRCKPPPPIEYFDCKGDPHDSQAEADAVSCAPPPPPPPPNYPKYTACDGTLHHSQEEADAIKCRGEETDELCELDTFAAGCDAF